MRKNLLILFIFILSLINIKAQTPVKIWTGIHEPATSYVSPTVTSVDFLPDGKIVSAGYNGLVKCWDTNGNSTIIYQSEYLNGSRSAINSISVDGNKIAIGQDNGLVKVINGDDFNIGVRVLKVSANSNLVSAVGATNIVYINGQNFFQTGNGSYNYAVTLNNDKIAFGGTESAVYSSWQSTFFANDWIFDLDYKNNNLATVGASQYLFVNNSIVYTFPDKGNSSVSINNINNKILIANWKPAIYLLNSDMTLDKVFNESNLIRCIKWNQDGSKFIYGTADGRVVYCLPQYDTTSKTSTNTTQTPTKIKGRK